MKNKYIIKSTSHIIISNEIKKITESIENVSYFSMNDTELDDIIVDASYFGFLDTAKAIVITEFNYFGDKFKHEEESEKIIEFLKKLDERCTVIFVVSSLDSRKDFTKKVLELGTELLDFSNLSPETIKNNVDQYDIDRLKDSISSSYSLSFPSKENLKDSEEFTELANWSNNDDTLILVDNTLLICLGRE